MAKIIFEGKEQEVKDNDLVKDACEELGVMFACETGICATCNVEVEEGMENLSEKTQAEQDMELEPKQRLMCQCSIKKGTVKIKSAY